MPTPRAFLAAASVNGKIYAIGGDEVDAQTAVEVYDAATNTWTTVAPLPNGRGDLAVAGANGKIYAIGGTPEETLSRCTTRLRTLGVRERPCPSDPPWQRRRMTQTVSFTR